MLNVAILGFGTVGSGVAEVLTMNKDLLTKKVGQELNLKYILEIRLPRFFCFSESSS